MTLSRVHALLLLMAALLAAWPVAGGTVAYGAAPSADSSPAIATGRLIEVPADVPTLEASIVAAQPGDVILLAAGTYRGGVTIPKEKHDLTIRGADRNRVIFDGKDVLLSAIEIKADRVSLENLTARHYTANGFEWEGVDGFSGRYLTVWNVGLYGIYAIESRHGTFQHDLVSGAADAAYYVGECQPCDTVVSHVTARYSAIGYSGTNAGGNLEVRDSLFDRNGTGILPNSYEGQEAPPPERDTRISGNTVRDSGSVPVPANSPLAGFVGLGIGIAGGMDNVLEGNTVTGSARFGIAVFPTLQESRNVFAPSGNQIRGNTVAGSRTADLVFSTGNGSGNCFADNQYTSSLPTAIEALLPCGAGATSSPPGDPLVGRELAIPIPEALHRLGKRPDYTTMPAPEDAETLMDPLPAGLRPFGEASPLNNAPPASADPAGIAPMAAGLLVVLVALVLVGSIIARRAMRHRGQQPPGA
jgi:Right handed beta helix region